MSALKIAREALVEMNFRYIKNVISIFVGLLSVGVALAQESESNLKDSQILNIMVNLNNSEILEGRLAKQKTSNQEVRAFAEEMVDEHSQDNKALQKLKKDLKLRPESTDFSDHFKKIAAENIKSLKKVKARIFDLDYMTSQVSELQEDLKILNEKLIPKAKSPKLMQMLNQVKESLQHRFKEAVKLKDSLKPRFNEEPQASEPE